MADVPKTSKSCDYHPCVFTGCRRNKAKYPDLHFFRFPCKRPKICEQWLVNCANNSLSSLPRNKLHSKKVCELHFTEDCFTSTMRTFLKKTAVPTLLYDGTPLQISQPSPTALLQADVPHGGVSSASKSRKTSSSKMLFRISTIDTSQRPTSSDFIKIPLYINLKSIKNSEPSPWESCAVNHTEQIPKSHSDEDRHQALSMSADNDGAAQGNPSSMPGPSTSGQESEKGLEAEVPESSGASSIESVPCASTSNIQFVASEITSMQDPEFGTLEKSGMSQTVLTPPPPPLKEGTSTQSQDVACGEEKEKQASLEESINIPSVDTTQKIPTSTVVNAEVAESIYPCRPKTSNILEESESDRLLRSMISAKKLDTVVERLEAVSNKLTLNTLSDQYDHFGKYIGSVLRGLPLKKVNSLKKKILSDIEAVMEEKESYLKSIGTQVGLDVLASEKSFKKYLKEKSQAKTVPADSKSLASNTPILGGNMPLLFPGASTSSFKLLPVIPMSATTSMVSSATLVTTPSLVSSVTSVHNVPVSTCETVTTVAKSADGTLLAVTIPKPKMCEAIVGPGQSLLIPPRGQKRKQTTAAYIIKKVPAPTSCETATLPTRITTSCVTTLPTRITTSCVTTTLPTRMTTSCESTTLPTRMTTPGDAFSLNKQTISYSESGTQTGGDLQLQEDSRDSGGGDMSFIVPQPLKNEEQEFEMDFEEGNELAQIKQDQDFFETVLCGESSSMYIKEETPDLEEHSEGDLGAPPLPPVTISTPLICPICNTQCNNGDELARHHFSTHPGCVPPLFILPQGGAIS